MKKITVDTFFFLLTALLGLQFLHHDKGDSFTTKIVFKKSTETIILYGTQFLNCLQQIKPAPGFSDTLLVSNIRLHNAHTLFVGVTQKY
jgi:hypothetical protein